MSYDLPIPGMIPAAEFQYEMRKIYEKLNAGTLHMVWCNADHEKQVGCDMCSCLLGKVIKDLRRQLNDALNLETNKKE